MRFYIPDDDMQYFHRPENNWIYGSVNENFPADSRSCRGRLVVAVLDGIGAGPLQADGLDWANIHRWSGIRNLVADDEYAAAVHVSAAKVTTERKQGCDPIYERLTFHGHQVNRGVWHKVYWCSQFRFFSREAEEACMRYGQNAGSYWEDSETDHYALAYIEFWPVGGKDFFPALSTLNKNFIGLGYARRNEPAYQEFQEIEAVSAFGLSCSWDSCCLWQRKRDASPYLIDSTRGSSGATLWSNKRGTQQT